MARNRRINLQRLQDLILAQPNQLQLLSDPEIAEELNRVGAGTGTVTTKVIQSCAAQAKVDPVEYGLLDQAGRDLWATIISAGSLKLIDADLRSQLTTLWPAGSNTRSRLQALFQRKASAIEVEFGDNLKVTHLEVAAALQGVARV